MLNNKGGGDGRVGNNQGFNFQNRLNKYNHLNQVTGIIGPLTLSQDYAEFKS